MSDLSDKTLLLIGGDPFSVDIVRKAREMGIRTIVTDWYDTDRSPAKKVADAYWDISIQDYDALSCKMKEASVDGVLTGFTDSYLLPYARLCAMNGLPCYGSEELFTLFTDKARYKAACREFGVPTVEAYAPDDPAIRFPVLVKPVDGSGSRGITICKDRKELEVALDRARSSSSCGEALIERYMDGREVTVFWVFIDGEAYLTAIGNRHVKQTQEGNIIPLPVGYTFPASIVPAYQAQIEPKAKAMFASLGVRNGMLFMQCKVEDDICYVYDIGYRLTGSLEYKLLARTCGYDPLEMLIRFALTGQMCEDPKAVIPRIDPAGMSPAYNVSCLCAPGLIRAIEGVEDVKKEKSVIDVLLTHFPGHRITEQMKGLLAQITVRVLGSVERKEDLYPAMASIWERLHIISDDGKELLLPGISREDIEGLVL